MAHPSGPAPSGPAPSGPAPSGPARAWRSVRQVPSRTPLRVKLIAAVLAMVTAALAVISIAGIAFLRGYLLHNADEQLRNAATGANAASVVGAFLGTGQTQPTFVGGLSIQWLPTSGKMRQVATEYSGYRSGQPHAVPGPLVRRSDPWLQVPGPTTRNTYSWLNTSGAPVSAPVTVGSISGERRWRVVSSAAVFHSFGQSFRGTIIIGMDVTDVYRTLNELTVIDLIVSGALLLVLAVFGVILIGSSMRPLTDIEQTAEAIAAGDLSRRVPERDPRTEVGKLGRSLNLMLAQIETAFQARTASEEAARRSEEAARRSALAAGRSEDRLRQFVADASHELRTPLTTIRGFAEYYRQRGGVERGGVECANGSAADQEPAAPETAPAAAATTAAAAAGHERASAPSAGETGPLTHADLDRIIERVEQEAARMGLLVEDMLLLARLDQQRDLDFKTVDLLAIAADALHDARVIAPRRTINLTVSTSEAPLVTGDDTGLRQVVGNLMSNAMTHTPDGTPIEITIRSGTLADGSPAVVLEVTDSGPGLTQEQKDHVFERFYRTDRARSRTAGGTGLGLAIVAALISAHRGQVFVDSEPGAGATFGFGVPLAPEAHPASS
ncbi:MAG TPA: HAMP domain-containing sensor histidine kinase [Streptosporangiaceae bacterium]